MTEYGNNTPPTGQQWGAQGPAGQANQPNPQQPTYSPTGYPQQPGPGYSQHPGQPYPPANYAQPAKKGGGGCLIVALVVAIIVLVIAVLLFVFKPWANSAAPTTEQTISQETPAVTPTETPNENTTAETTAAEPTPTPTPIPTPESTPTPTPAQAEGPADLPPMPAEVAGWKQLSPADNQDVPGSTVAAVYTLENKIMLAAYYEIPGMTPELLGAGLSDPQTFGDVVCGTDSASGLPMCFALVHNGFVTSADATQKTAMPEIVEFTNALRQAWK